MFCERLPQHTRKQYIDIVDRIILRMGYCDIGTYGSPWRWNDCVTRNQNANSKYCISAMAHSRLNY